MIVIYMSGAQGPPMTWVALIDPGLYSVVSCALVDMICTALRLEPSSVTWMLSSLFVVSEHFAL